MQATHTSSDLQVVWAHTCCMSSWNCELHITDGDLAECYSDLDLRNALLACLLHVCRRRVRAWVPPGQRSAEAQRTAKADRHSQQNSEHSMCDRHMQMYINNTIHLYCFLAVNECRRRSRAWATRCP
jgi:hypothetical protein